MGVKMPRPATTARRQAGDEIADEHGRDDDRPRRDEPHRDGIEKLAFGQPVLLGDHALSEEGDDGQAAAEDEGAGLEEEEEESATRVAEPAGSCPSRRDAGWRDPADGGPGE